MTMTEWIWVTVTFVSVALILVTGFLVMRRNQRESLAMLEKNKKSSSATKAKPKQTWDGYTNVTTWAYGGGVTYGSERLPMRDAFTPCVYEVLHVRFVQDDGAYRNGLAVNRRESRLTYVLAEADTCVDAWVDLARSAGLPAFSIRYGCGTEPLSAAAREAETGAARHADVLVAIGTRFVKENVSHEDPHIAACIKGASLRGAKLVGTETHAVDSDEARRILVATVIALETR